MEDRTDRLHRLDTDKLIDVVKNHRQYGYDDSLRDRAIAILEERGITSEVLEVTGSFTNRTYQYVEDIYASFNRNSWLAFVFYMIFLFLLIVPVVFGSSSLLVVAGLKVVVCALFILFLVRSFLDQNRFDRVLGDDDSSHNVLAYVLLGLPLYVMMFFHFRKQMREKLLGIR